MIGSVILSLWDLQRQWAGVVKAIQSILVAKAIAAEIRGPKELARCLRTPVARRQYVFALPKRLSPSFSRA